MTTQTASKQPLIRKYHTLASKAGLSQQAKSDMLYDNYGVKSSTRLSAMQLQELCSYLKGLTNPITADLDKARKRLIASIFAWLKALNKDSNMVYVKAIACRSAQKEISEFNKIPLDRLRSLYGAFTKRTKDLQTTDMLTSEELIFLQINN